MSSNKDWENKLKIILQPLNGDEIEEVRANKNLLGWRQEQQDEYIRDTIINKRTLELIKHTNTKLNNKVIELGVSIHEMADFIANQDVVMTMDIEKLGRTLKRRKILKEAMEVVKENSLKTKLKKDGFEFNVI